MIKLCGCLVKVAEIMYKYMSVYETKYPKISDITIDSKRYNWDKSIRPDMSRILDTDWSIAAGQSNILLFLIVFC